MRFPLTLTTTMAGYIARKKITREKRFPLVLMLEPLHACNLTCTGCGRIREYKQTIKEKLTVAECLASVDECGAPIVSICGGEPMIYPELGPLVRGILKRRKHIYLCTNGMFIRKRLHEFRPTSRFFFNVHLDGLEKTHDLAVERPGVFKAAVDGLKAAKLGVDGFMLSPAYGYTAVQQTNPEAAAEIFLTRDDIRAKFKEAEKLLAKYKMMSSPVYLEFLSGKRELTCTAWGNPTRNVKGWKGPCYLITDEHHETFRGLMDDTDWDSYGYGNDPRCEHCMVHYGYEPSAALGLNKKP